MSKIALLGYGKMGKMIETISIQRNHQIILKIDADNRNSITTAMIQQADVVIEFTHPQSAVENISFCIEAKVPVICGTTGWLKHWNTIVEKCNRYKGSMIYASNFSVGVNIFFSLNTYLATLMNGQGYDVKIEEIHHTEKKDAPSGTAISLGEQIIEKINEKKSWVNQSTQDVDKIGIVSQRIDTTPGMHIVKYASSVDDIEIKHTAHNREGFALGAILAAEYLIKQPPGIYTMKDVLQF